MREIEDATTRISTLLAAVKQYSGMDRTPYEHVDLVEGIDSTLTMLGQKIGRSITVVRDYGADVPTVPGYGAELNQVWTNLIDNAVQAMEGSGTLTVRTRRAEDGERVVVEIGDTGPRRARAHPAARIFEPFSRRRASARAPVSGSTSPTASS
jgi:signal transduction histidine kinase